MSRSGRGLWSSHQVKPLSPSSSCVDPTKRMSPLWRNFATFMARNVASMLATEAVLSPTPGAKRVSPLRRTVRGTSLANTTSVCAAITMVGPPPVPLRTPVTLPMESTRMSVSPSFSNTAFT